MFSPVIGESIIRRAQAKGLTKINIHNLRDYTSDPHKKIDAPSYGSGGMVFKPEPIFNSVESILGYKANPLGVHKKGTKKSKNKFDRIILFTPQGTTLKQKMIKKYLAYERLILIAPRYEGVDERVRKYLVDDEISIGDYVLSGGELAAMVFIDCLVRIIPGVVSDKESIKNESFENSCLDFSHYTRPSVFRGLKVPKVLLSGNHEKIAQWRRHQALAITKKRRPDLLIENNK
jgi:tRNA (guanine37-N1)-methyltransferase